MISPLPGGMDDTGGQKSTSEIEAEIERLTNELQARKDELKKQSWPVQAKFYTHGDKESNWSQAEELKLVGEAQRTFAYTGLEVEFDILVTEAGEAMATHVNGVALTQPVSI